MMRMMMMIKSPRQSTRHVSSDTTSAVNSHTDDWTCGRQSTVVTVYRDCGERHLAAFLLTTCIRKRPRGPGRRRLTVVDHAAQFGRLVLEIGQFEAQLEVLLFEEGGADGDLVLFGAPGVARPLGRLVVLAPALPVGLVLDLLAVAAAFLGAAIGRTCVDVTKP